MMFRAETGARLAFAAVFVASVSAISCGEDSASGDGEPSCLEAAGPLDCRGSYGYDAATQTVRPTYQQVYDNTLKPRCASAGCHSGSAPAGGLQLGTVEEAYAALQAMGSNGIPRVKGGDVRCGKVIVRLETHGQPWSMPPGTPLTDPDLCSVRNWIANGAAR